MKIRTGFVSNSSSTSFTCDISGQSLSGRDGQDYEDECCDCAAGHSFLASYLLTDEETVKGLTIEDKRAEVFHEEYDNREWLGKYFNCRCKSDYNTNQHSEVGSNIKKATNEQIEEIHAKLLAENRLMAWADSYHDGTQHDVTSARCPICQMQVLPDSIALQYLVKEFCGGNTIQLFKAIKERFSTMGALQAYLKDKE